MKHLEMVDSTLTTKFYILCGCKEHLMSDSEMEAAVAWNEANAPAK